MYTNPNDYKIECPKCNSKTIIYAVRLQDDGSIIETITGKSLDVPPYEVNAILNILLCEKCLTAFPVRDANKAAITRALEQLALASDKRVRDRIAKQG